jgi:MSHA biogenesis protein MshI
MLGFPSRKKTTWRTGLVHTAATRAIAVVSRRPGEAPILRHAAVAGRAKGVLAWRATQKLLEQMPRRKSPVSAVLDAIDYQLLVTESPGLGADDTRAAVRWMIKDQIDFPAEEAVVDTFQLPAARGNEGMLQVVVSQASCISELEAIVDGTACDLDVIDIPELALRNLMALTPQDSSGCLFVLLGRGHIFILISCLGVLYVARRIDAALGADADQLALEIQRSMQYYESQFDRAPINEILLGPANEATRALAPRLAEACGAGCEALALSALLRTDPGVIAVEQPELLLAVSAALRHSTTGFAA